MFKNMERLREEAQTKARQVNKEICPLSIFAFGSCFVRKLKLLRFFKGFWCGVGESSRSCGQEDLP